MRSHSTMLKPCAFDFVIEVTRCFLSRCSASSKAKRTMRSMPRRVKTEVWIATSSGWCWYTNPPTCAYSPSVFSRTTTKSISPPRGFAQRRLHAGIEKRRPHIGVLIESPPDGQQQPVQRDVIGNIGMADRAQQDGVAGLQQVDGAGGHHAAPAEKVLRAPVEILKRESDIVFFSRPPSARAWPAGRPRFRRHRRR